MSHCSLAQAADQHHSRPTHSTALSVERQRAHHRRLKRPGLCAHRISRRPESGQSPVHTADAEPRTAPPAARQAARSASCEALPPASAAHIMRGPSVGPSPRRTRATHITRLRALRVDALCGGNDEIRVSTAIRPASSRVTVRGAGRWCHGKSWMAAAASNVFAAGLPSMKGSSVNVLSVNTKHDLYPAARRPRHVRH